MNYIILSNIIKILFIITEIITLIFKKFKNEFNKPIR